MENGLATQMFDQPHSPANVWPVLAPVADIRDAFGSNAKTVATGLHGDRDLSAVRTPVDARPATLP